MIVNGNTAASRMIGDKRCQESSLGCGGRIIRATSCVRIDGTAVAQNDRDVERPANPIRLHKDTR